MTSPQIEREANLFAMLLLMPKEFIKKDIETEWDIFDDKIIKILADKYQVPVTALVVRINLFKTKNI